MSVAPTYLRLAVDIGRHLLMRPSDTGMCCSKTIRSYPNHRSPPWPPNYITPSMAILPSRNFQVRRSLEPTVKPCSNTAAQEIPRSHMLEPTKSASTTTKGCVCHAQDYVGKAETICNQPTRCLPDKH